MTERITIENLDRLERLSSQLEGLQQELELNTFADAAGEIEQAVDRIVANLDEFLGLLGFDATDPRNRRQRDQVEQFLRTSQGALAGFERGALLSNAFFRRNPFMRVLFTAMGLAIGSHLGFTEQERQAQAARARLNVDTLRRSQDRTFQREVERLERQRALRLQGQAQ